MTTFRKILLWIAECPRTSKPEMMNYWEISIFLPRNYFIEACVQKRKPNICREKTNYIRTITEERHVDKDYERNLSHITLLSARKLPEVQKTLKHPQNQCNPVAIDAVVTLSDKGEHVKVLFWIIKAQTLNVLFNGQSCSSGTLSSCKHPFGEKEKTNKQSRVSLTLSSKNSKPSHFTSFNY